MPAVARCPEVDRYRLLTSGQLPPAELDALLNHLEGCEACTAQMTTVIAASDQDTLVELVRQSQGKAADAGSERLNLLVQRLRQGPPAAFDPSSPAQNESLATRSGLVQPDAGSATPWNTAAERQESEIPATMAARGSPSPDSPSPQETHVPEAAKTTARQRELTAFLMPPQGIDELGRLGTYRVLKILGAGGMGVVYKAEDPHLKRVVALKAILPGLGASGDHRERFLREARSAASLKHDHIVSIYQVGEDRGAPFLAMEFLEGEPLEDLLKRRQKVRLADVLRIGREVALGLVAAHKRGLIHRDIKPANLWLEARDDDSAAGGEPQPASGEQAGPLGPFRVKILDFGLARAVREEGHLTQSGVIVGTPAYMAPEQAKGRHVDGRCDLFSLGCVLYRLCTGELPFKGSDSISTLLAVAHENPRPPRELSPDLPASVSDLIMRLLAKDPVERTQSAADVAEQLRKIAADLPAAAVVPSVPSLAVSPSPSVSTATFPPATASSIPVSSAPSPQPAAERIGNPSQFEPQTARPSGPTGKRPRWLIAAACLLTLGAGGWFLAPVIFRLAMPHGTLTVEIDEDEADNVQLKVLKGGRQIELLDLKTKKEITLNTGEYELELVGGKDGLTLTTKQIDLKRGDRKIATVTYEPKIAAGPGPKGPPGGKGTDPKTDPAKKVDPGEKPDKPAKAAKEQPAAPPVALGESKFTFPGQTNTVTSVAFSPDGKFLASGTSDQPIRLWDLATGQEKATVEKSSPYFFVVFSGDGKTLASAGSELGTIKLWEVPGGQDKGVLTVNQSTRQGASGPVFSRDGKTLAVWCGFGGTIELFDMARRESKGTIKSDYSSPRGLSMAFSPDGKTLASIDGKELKIKLWDVANRREIKSWEAEGAAGRGPAAFLAFSDDGKILASVTHNAGNSGGTKGTKVVIELWDSSSGQRKSAFELDTGPSSSVALSPDFNTFASAALVARPPSTIKLWDVANGREKASFKGQNSVSCLAFSPDGKFLASGGNDGVEKSFGKTQVRGTTKLWDLSALDDFQLEPGFTSLFNGKDLTGWRHPYLPGALEPGALDGKTETPDGGVAVKDGVIFVKTADQRFQLLTNKRFGNDFVLKLQVKGSLTKTGAGISTDGLGSFPLERTHHPNLKHDDWNDLEFTTNFKDKSAILSVNGVNLPITFSKGPVTFYLGGKSPNLQFRRIRVKELGGDDFQPEPGFTSLFNGKDLTGWRQLKPGSLDGKTETPNGRVAVKDGVIIIEEGPADFQFLTTKSFGNDFVLKLQCKGMNNYSGIGIYQPGLSFGLETKKFSLKRDDWNDLELAVNFKEKSAFVLVNGVKEADHSVLAHALSRGPFTIRLGGAAARLEFRRIRIKELGGDDFQPEPGFTPLFNGKDLTGWVGGNSVPLDGKTETPDGRGAVKDGVIIFEKQSGVPSSNIKTRRGFGKDFVLKLQFKGRNSTGIGIVAPSDTRHLQGTRNLDNDSWNDLELTVNFKENSGILSINGDKYVLDGSKGYFNRMFSRGPIGFFLGGTDARIEVRRIRVKELGGDDFQPEPGFTSLFDGKDLTGWKLEGIAEKKAKFGTKLLDGKTETETPYGGRVAVEDGVIVVDSGRIHTARSFDKQFVLKLQFKDLTPKKGEPIGVNALTGVEIGAKGNWIPAEATKAKAFRDGWNDLEITYKEKTGLYAVNGVNVHSANFPASLRGPSVLFLGGRESKFEYRRIRIKDGP